MAATTEDTGPVYVLADDGLWYANPAVTGDRWRLTFDEPVGAVLTMSYPRRKAPQDPERWAALLLAEAGLTAAVLLLDYEIEAATGRRTWRFQVCIAEPPPAALMRKGAGRWQPGRVGTLFAFGRTWG